MSLHTPASLFFHGPDLSISRVQSQMKESTPSLAIPSKNFHLDKQKGCDDKPPTEVPSKHPLSTPAVSASDLLHTLRSYDNNSSSSSSSNAVSHDDDLIFTEQERRDSDCAYVFSHDWSSDMEEQDTTSYVRVPVPSGYEEDALARSSSIKQSRPKISIHRCAYIDKAGRSDSESSDAESLDAESSDTDLSNASTFSNTSTSNEERSRPESLLFWHPSTQPSSLMATEAQGGAPDTPSADTFKNKEAIESRVGYDSWDTLCPDVNSQHRVVCLRAKEQLRKNRVSRSQYNKTIWKSGVRLKIAEPFAAEYFVDALVVPNKRCLQRRSRCLDLWAAARKEEDKVCKNFPSRSSPLRLSRAIKDEAGAPANHDCLEHEIGTVGPRDWKDKRILC